MSKEPVLQKGSQSPHRAAAAVRREDRCEQVWAERTPVSSVWAEEEKKS